MKVDNEQIAKAVFFKLYHHLTSGTIIADNNLFDRAALRLASGIFQGTLTLHLNDCDHLIEGELEKFGCKLSIGRNGNSASFNLNGQTEIESTKWQKMCNEIYNENGTSVQSQPSPMLSKIIKSTPNTTAANPARERSKHKSQSL